MKDYLLIYDTPSIKKYVFGTEKLKEIRGASAILDHLNRDESLKVLQNSLEAGKVEKIYANGGTAQFIIKDAKEEEIKKAIAKLKKTYTDNTFDAVKIVCGYAEYDSKNYQKSIRECYFHINKEKNSRFEKTSDVNSFSKECKSCSNNSANQIFETPDGEKTYLCSVCATKRSYTNSSTWNEFCKSIGITDNKHLRPSSFKDIGDDIAIVYADGNAMGKLIKKIDDKNDYEKFARITDSSIREACYETLAKTFHERESKFPADILLLGGDDLIVVIKAKNAVQFAYDVSTRFNELSIEKLKDEKADKLLKLTENRGLTISVGISIAKANYPFRILLEQSEELLKLAKKSGTEEFSKENNNKDICYSPSYIDFHINKQANQVGISSFRNANYIFEKGKDKYNRSIRPLNLEKTYELINSIKIISKIPKTRLNLLNKAVYETSYNRIKLDFIKAYARSKDNEKDENSELKRITKVLNTFGCMENIPWNSQNKTVITDLIDLLDYLEG